MSIRLWDSWEDGAEVGDKAAGVYADDSRIHELDYRGEFFKVRGPLNVPRSPQGRPLLVQAGSSHDGREFAARYAEAVFTAQQTLGDAQEFYADLKARVGRLGRDPDQVKILPGLVPAIGSTETEAGALETELEELIIPEYGLAARALRDPAAGERVHREGTGRRGVKRARRGPRAPASLHAMPVDFTRFAAVLRDLGVPGQVRELPESAPTAAAAAAQLGCELGAIANSLVFSADGAPLLVMTSGAHRVDTAWVARLTGVAAVCRANARSVREWTGQAIGGVAPVGHPSPIRTLVDTWLDKYDVVWAAGGHPHTVFPTSYAELLRITGGTPADVGEAGE